ncbi:hypothetical protein BS17DRAFT_425439 [Gyrodon lividus]|nr:hypothetical protein BS17DRAFT_425439 [Gyrodon lividus]
MRGRTMPHLCSLLSSQRSYSALLALLLTLVSTLQFGNGPSNRVQMEDAPREQQESGEERGPVRLSLTQPREHNKYHVGIGSELGGDQVCVAQILLFQSAVSPFLPICLALHSYYFPRKTGYSSRTSHRYLGIGCWWA